MQIFRGSEAQKYPSGLGNFCSMLVFYSCLYYFLYKVFYSQQVYWLYRADCNKTAPVGWLKRKDIYSLTVLEARHLTSSGQQVHMSSKGSLIPCFSLTAHGFWLFLAFLSSQPPRSILYCHLHMPILCISVCPLCSL